MQTDVLLSVNDLKTYFSTDDGVVKADVFGAPDTVETESLRRENGRQRRLDRRDSHEGKAEPHE